MTSPVSSGPKPRKPIRLPLRSSPNKFERKRSPRGALKEKPGGRAEGEARGRAEVVLRLLTLRFGPLPADVAERVRGADVSLLDAYAERLLTALSLEDVLR
jgi:hypothetical protein